MSSNNQYHVQAQWITVEIANVGLLYFKLTKNGDLDLTNGELIPHHFEYSNDNGCRMLQDNNFYIDDKSKFQSLNYRN